MEKDIEVSMRYGSIRFVQAIEAIPDSVEINGNVTVTNSGSPGLPARFDTKFYIDVTSRDGIFEVTNHIEINDFVVADGVNVLYSEIEESASKNVSPLLRAIADKIDEQIADYERRKSVKNSE